MHPWLKRAIGAAGIAVGFLLWQGSPAGASEPTHDPLASAVKGGPTAGLAALDAISSQATSGHRAAATVTAGLELTAGESGHSGRAGGEVRSRVTLGGSEVRAHNAASGRIEASAPHAVPTPAAVEAQGGLTARARLARAKLQRPEPTVDAARTKAKRAVTTAKKRIGSAQPETPDARHLVASGQAEGRERLVEALDDVDDAAAAAERSVPSVCECLGQLEPESLADEGEDALPNLKGGGSPAI